MTSYLGTYATLVHDDLLRAKTGFITYFCEQRRVSPTPEFNLPFAMSSNLLNEKVDTLTNQATTAR